MIKKQSKEIELELEEKFHGRIIQNGKLAESYKRLGFERKATNVELCGTDLWWRTFPNTPEPPKLYKANFCKDRLCPMCGWRRTKKIFGQLSKIMDKLDENYHFVFATLTVRNCSSEELANQIQALFKAFDLFSHYKEVKQAFKGYFRALEITRQEEEKRLKSTEWHPHFHVIYAVQPSYFTSRYYISHEKLKDLWKQAFHANYDPSVRIEKVKPKDGKKRKTENENLDALHEVAKYSVKSFDYISDDQEDTDYCILNLMGSLSSHRLCGMGGVFRKTAKELELDDMTDGDLVNTDNEEIRADLGGLLVRYQWRVGWGYEQTEIQDFNEYKANLEKQRYYYDTPSAE